ncbi:MAG: glucose-6-phosphate isomerase [Gammaproteobacteria bacterium]|nr:glucose-6-phosphate isomerase [Gammaproteobacteria bacterium]MYF62457.1 glucose-6-phosphate isomerase [Gammaproteobacteria bacterium]MYI21306.1 glucose-6-phosphate isomerase [Gammaproteobacteria bacterium]
MSALTVDYRNLLAIDEDEDGVDPERLNGDLGSRFRAAHGDVERARRSGSMGFLDLPRAAESTAHIRRVAAGLRGRFDDFVVLGIGGSALGTRTLRDALGAGDSTRGARDAGGHHPRLHVADNIDPHSIGTLLDRLDMRRTFFNVVSKSGSTTETLAQYLVVAERLAREVGRDRAREHLLFTTDPERGPLRALSEAAGIPTLPVPDNVGGRFSVLSAVGLFPAAAAGLDVAAVLRGAARMERRCRTDELTRNPAGVVATLLYRADVECGQRVHVFMPYCDRLRSFALWVQQLWGESLGKAARLDGRPAATGPTPLPAAGATDQHSLLQLFMEGPADKVVCFVTVDAADDPVPIGKAPVSLPVLEFPEGHTLNHLIAVEHAATAAALRMAGRPNLTVRLATLDADALGELILLFQAATVYAGYLYGVDALTQPGVELGKRYVHGLLGRPGYHPPRMEEANHPWQV